MIIHHSDRSRMSSYEDRNAEDDRFDPVEEEQKHSMPPRNRLQYESTRDGDILVVDRSYDCGEGDDRAQGAETTFSGGETRSSPSRRRGHSRNLSEHFYDATKLTSDHAPGDSANDFEQYRDDPLYPLPGPASGQKHRRGMSGDAANPPEAHRRINSIGNSATIHRRPYIQERQHQRVDSAGLDILTAAVDVSREELASAAGERAARDHWEHVRSGARRSPIELIPYDHNPGAPPSHSPRGHPHGYAGGPPPPPYYASHGYPQSPYPPPSYYGPPPNSGYQRTVPGAPIGGYPVQYARGSDPYVKPSAHGPLHQQGLERQREESPNKDLPADKVEMTAPPPVQPSHWRSGVGATPALPMYVTSNQQNGDYGHGAMDSHHHCRIPSVSSWAPPMPAFMGAAPGEYTDHPLKGHHRATSSSVSFLGLDVGALDNTDATFLKNLQASTGAPVPAFGLTNVPAKQERQHSDQESTDDDGKGKLALGGTSKRVRRKCNITGCPNRVVQGGLCISHGAKRKQCKHPGCNKNVKKAGLCSTHGPARKRCEYDGCGKVAVQGGRCIAHGAKKKLCSMDGCTKQAILAGMCKKHHDQARKHSDGMVPPPGDLTQCKEIEVKPETTKSDKGQRKPTHTRGLSLFQEMSPEIVGNILGEDVDAPGAPAPGQHHHQSTFSRDFSSLY